MRYDETTADDPLRVQSSPAIGQARSVARHFPDEFTHFEQVARLSGLLFDELAELHGLGRRDRELLVCAALMHDIGRWASGGGHHKKSLKFIRDESLPELTDEEQDVVANVARYHRKAAPSPSHRRFAVLAEAAKDRVRRLAPILRLANGLDRSHDSSVSQLDVRMLDGPPRCHIRLYGAGDLDGAAETARRKTDLFEATYHRAVVLDPHGLSRPPKSS
jgi:exopolyphosphatase/guanosine-5'-triphosphate,3'-diphosphate pyrophosphatase